jgi:imidazoleglycerol-phosphate dehydratase/histidinol-phosphatase
MKVIFLDRDGTIIVEPPDEQIDSLEKLEMIHGVFQGLRLLSDFGYALVMVSNQDDLGSSTYPIEAFNLVQDKLVRLLAGEGIQMSKVFICPHSVGDGCSCRKPKTGLVEEYIRENNVDLARSWVFGDRETDVQFARALGCRSARLTTDPSTQAECASASFLEICQSIVRRQRTAVIQRNTSETAISVEVCLDGSGNADVATGIGFFDHMLAQLAKHSGLDMTVRCTGDLRVDEHHSVEDAGLAIGEAVRNALGDKRGIQRYGFLLPMDESLAHVALDLSGRPYCSFKVKFHRETVGEFPTELTEDFFRALADGLRANLHIAAEGRNDHHKIEAIFKAVGRSLRQAVSRAERDATAIPSTKGVL